MGIGNYQRQSQYFNNPQIYKPLEEIYSDLDSWTKVKRKEENTKTLRHEEKEKHY